MLLGKLRYQGRINAVAPGDLLFVRDAVSKRLYLVDTGASFSVMPFKSSSPPTGPRLMGPDDKNIPCWGYRRFFLIFGGRHYVWHFLLAAVKFPIVRVDFLKHFQLLVDPAGQRLLEAGSRRPVAVAAEATAAAACVAEAAAVRLAVTYTIQPSTPGNDATRGETQCEPAVAAAAAPAAAPASRAATCGDKSLRERLKRQFPEVFNPSKILPVATHGVEHHVVTAGPPVASKFRRLDPEKLAAAKADFDKMEAEGIIRRSTSPWSSPLHPVKKDDGSWRPCGDFRRLNLVTVPDAYPLPNMLDFGAKMAGCSIFSKIDLRKGYHQIPMHSADIPKTAITTPFGLYEFLRMPFGLRNAGCTFQRLMDRALSNLDGFSGTWMISTQPVPLPSSISNILWPCSRD
jgi:Reverse transcriptase (RNA-dependent DNA polymerase)